MKATCIACEWGVVTCVPLLGVSCCLTCRQAHLYPHHLAGVHRCGGAHDYVQTIREQAGGLRSAEPCHCATLRPVVHHHAAPPSRYLTRKSQREFHFVGGHSYAHLPALASAHLLLIKADETQNACRAPYIYDQRPNCSHIPAQRALTPRQAPPTTPPSSRGCGHERGCGQQHRTPENRTERSAPGPGAC